MIVIAKKLITPVEIKKEIAMNDRLALIRNKKLGEIRQILTGNDKRLLVIVGPCSADSAEAFFSYLELLKRLEREVNDKILIVPRLYTAKPRSKGDAYKGILYSESPKGSVIDFERGLISARKMFIAALSDFEFVCADELLHTDTYDYFDDIAGYAVIGARNAESQQHRFLASGLDIPVAVKNPLSGSLDALSNAIYTSQRKNSFIYNGYQAETSGNPFAHAVLRGGVDRTGKHFSNYSIDDLIFLKNCFDVAGVRNPAVIIDANHSNSAKRYENQGKIIIDSFQNIQKHPEIRRFFVGYMIESYIKDGSCEAGKYEFGKSVTDGCLGFEKTEILINQLAALV